MEINKGDVSLKKLMTINMANNYTTKIKGLLYFLHNTDYAVHFAPVFSTILRSILKRSTFSTFPQMCTLRSRPQTKKFWSNIGKSLIINIIFP